LSKIKKLKIEDLTPSLQKKLDASFKKREPEILERMQKLKKQLKERQGRKNSKKET